MPVPTLSRIAPAQPPPESNTATGTPLRELATPEEWCAESPEGLVQTRSLHSIAWRLNSNADSGFYERLRPIPTGFDALDQWIGSGIRPGELALIGGAQGVGKTTFCLQIARNIAAGGDANVLYACYEHPEEYVLNRLLVQESIDPTVDGPASGFTLDDVQQLMATGFERHPGREPFDAIRGHPAGARALAALGGYAGRFHLVADASRRNSIETLSALVAEHRKRDRQPLVLFVDYLQKVEPVQRDLPDEAERVTQVVQGLKQLALDFNVAVVAIVAAEKAGLEAARLRITHLRGSSALMYEADLAIIMNDKWKIIDRDHIVFNQHKAQQYRDWVICTIEKNRSGKNLVEIEFMKRFEFCCFNPKGGKVSERLYEERIRGEQA
ncbi:MAG: DnaB-like helicase C-terminal domain-containing protein [Thermomicrobiales bacterium]